MCVCVCVCESNLSLCDVRTHHSGTKHMPHHNIMGHLGTLSKVTKARGCCCELDVLHHWAAATPRHSQNCNAIALPAISGELKSELLRDGETVWLNAEPLACGVSSWTSVQKCSSNSTSNSGVISLADPGLSLKFDYWDCFWTQPWAIEWEIKSSTIWSCQFWEYMSGFILDKVQALSTAVHSSFV